LAAASIVSGMLLPDGWAAVLRLGNIYEYELITIK
jgi:hypothetical protein